MMRWVVGSILHCGTIDFLHFCTHISVVVVVVVKNDAIWKFI